ncbi:pentapeptide repeat-containing protein [Bradyrhizobium tropiciagri]|nr:pentapeptide repeat-containing protein [Bradyrhizobium tropiciagri]
MARQGRTNLALPAIFRPNTGKTGRGCPTIRSGTGLRSSTLAVVAGSCSDCESSGFGGSGCDGSGTDGSAKGGSALACANGRIVSLCSLGGSDLRGSDLRGSDLGGSDLGGSSSGASGLA